MHSFMQNNLNKMNISKVLFWNVDTQFDFVAPEGKLYVAGAELLKPVWSKLTALAEDHGIKVVSTADFHYPDSAELSAKPNFISTFPEHCMANTKGAEFIDETKPLEPVVLDWDKKYCPFVKLEKARNIVIRKDAFDVFKGSPHASSVLQILSPNTVFVYGVTTNVCVNDAVLGLVKQVKDVYVVEDAIKELPNIPLPFENWKKLGVKMITSEELFSIFR